MFDELCSGTALALHADMKVRIETLIAIVNQLPRDQVVADLARWLAKERHARAMIIAHLAVMERDRIYRALGYRSLRAYCIDHGFVPGTADARIRVARAALLHPRIVDDLSKGSLTLSAVRLLARHLDGPLGSELLDEAQYKTCRQIEAMLARRFPAPLSAQSVQSGADGLVEVSLLVSTDVVAKLEQARELEPTETLNSILDRSLAQFIAKKRNESLKARKRTKSRRRKASGRRKRGQARNSG